MMCAWKELLAILPQWLRREVELPGKDELKELRLRINSPPELVLGKSSRWLDRNASEEDIAFCVNAASRYSPWSASTMSQGYITGLGGHRLGLCGEAVCRNGEVTGLRSIHSICIRIARDFPGISASAELGGSVLILGAPGWGKTTLLRDLIRRISETSCVAVIDERGELFPQGFLRGKRMDILTGCPKPAGMDMVLRAMGPEWIAVDEITAQGDCDALVQAVGCGVKLLATAHAASLEEFRCRPIYQKIWDMRIFQTFLILHKDQTFHRERMGQWN